MKPLPTQHNNLSSFQMSTPFHVDTWSTEASKGEKKIYIVIRNTATGPNLISKERWGEKKKILQQISAEKVKI